MSDTTVLHSHAEPPPKQRSPWPGWMLKLAVAAGALSAIWLGNPGGVSRLAILQEHSGFLALAAFLRLAFTAVQGLRLHALTRASLPLVSRGMLLRATYIGQLCNQILPGSVGGDVVRGALIWRQQHVPWQQVLALLLMDRFIGLLSLTCLTMMLCPAALLGGNAMTWKALGVAGAGALLWAAWLGRHRWMAWAARWPVLRPALALPATLGRKPLTRAGLLALTGHGLFLVSGGLVFSAAEVPLDWPARLGVLTLSAFMGNLPLSLGGQGVREGTIILLLADPFHWWSGQPLATPEQAFVVAAGTWALHITTSVLGGLVALSFPANPPAPS